MPVLHREPTQKETQDVSHAPITGDIEDVNSDLVKPKEEKTKHDHRISLARNSWAKMSGHYESPVICRFDPRLPLLRYNLCYRFDKEGNWRPLVTVNGIRLT